MKINSKIISISKIIVASIKKGHERAVLQPKSALTKTAISNSYRFGCFVQPLNQQKKRSAQNFSELF